MPSRRRRNLPFVVRQSAGLALAVPEVMAHRLTRLWLAGPRPSQRDRDEFYRKGAEKLAAFYESWNAMFLEAYRVSLGLAFSPLWWLWLGARPRRVAHRVTAHGQRARADHSGPRSWSQFSGALLPMRSGFVARACDARV